MSLAFDELTPHDQALVIDRSIHWVYTTFRRSDAVVLVDEESGVHSWSQFQGNIPANHHLVPNGWDHEHCEFCWRKITEAPDESAGSAEASDRDGWYDGANRWLCNNCFDALLRPRIEADR